MDRKQTLAVRLREIFLDGHWIANTNYKEQILDVDWQQAIRPMGSFNTIAMLTYHVNYYLKGLLDAFENGKLGISDKYSFNLPPISSADDWMHLVNEFLHNAERFAESVEQMNDALLDKPFFDEKYGTYERNIEGVIEHSYYHLGQIVLLRKIML